jgi:hypothetical protein
VVRGTPGVRRRHALEAKVRQIEFVDEDIDHANRVVLGNIVVKTLGQQRNLLAVLAFDKSLHVAAPKKPLSSL